MPRDAVTWCLAIRIVEFPFAEVVVTIGPRTGALAVGLAVFPFAEVPLGIGRFIGANAPVPNASGGRTRRES